MGRISELPYLHQSPCQHWGVHVILTSKGSIACEAKRIFQLKGFGKFCESYEWICKQLLNCSQTRQVCKYPGGSALNRSISEHPQIGIYNLQMPELSPNKNIRSYVEALFKCNKKYGYPHRVFLYFATSKCKKSPCNHDLFGVEDKEKFAEMNADLLGLFDTARLSQTTLSDERDLINLWACKRDVLSTVSCPVFIQTCDIIKGCLLDHQEWQDVTLDLPHDDTCFSPLPLSTLNPLPIGDVGGRGYHPGILGDSLSHVLLLDKTYPRTFERLRYSGWDRGTGMDLRLRRTKLFFDLFLEDCRHRHQFEGFLIEPFLTESVDYLICSIPFGLDKLAENSLVTKGCSHIQETCEAMKKCYVHHAEYFGFHSFLNQYGFSVAILMTIIFTLATFSAFVTQML